MRLRFAACAATALRTAQPQLRNELRTRQSVRASAALVTAACAVTVSALASPSVYADDPQSMPPSVPTQHFDTIESLSHLKLDTNGWSALGGTDIGRALHAAESLVTLAADRDTHASLLTSGAVFALGTALQRALNDSSDAAAPLAANVLHALADIARTNPCAVEFQNAQIPLLLAEALKKFPVPRPEPVPWGEWFGSFFGFGYSPTPAAAADASAALHTDAEHGELAPLQLTDFSLSPPLTQTGNIVGVDIRPGIAYHAVRCVSNLARDSVTHTTLLDVGLLEVVASALNRSTVRQLTNSVSGDAQLLDTLRCATLSVAALAKSAGEKVIATTAHHRLLEFAACRSDPITQAYAAAGVRNLARHPVSDSPTMWQTHREIMVAGAPAALAVAMESSDNAQAQVFAVLAFGDLLTTGHYKAHIIRKRLAVAFPHFATLLTSSNPTIARAAMRVVHATYGKSTQSPPEALSVAIAPLLIKIVQGPVTRGDVLAMTAMASMASDPKLAVALADAGAIEALNVALKRGRGPYFEEATRAIAALAAHPGLAVLIRDRSALDAALKRPSVENGGYHSAALLANLARDLELRSKVAHAGLSVLLRAAHASEQDAQREAARGLYNLCLTGMSRVMVAQGGALSPLVKLAKSTDSVTRRCAVGALAAIAETYEYAVRFVEAGALNAVLNAAEKDSESRRDVARTLAHLASSEAVHGVVATGPAVQWLVDTVSAGGGRGKYAQDTMYFASIAICNLAYSPGVTRSRLRECGVMPTLAALASAVTGSPEVMHAARQALINIRDEKGLGMIPVDVSTREYLPA